MVAKFCWALGVLCIVVQFEGSASAQRIDAGRFSIFAMDSCGQAWGWGRNDQGQAGVGFISGASMLPTPLAISSPVVQCTSGTNHGLFLLANGTVMAAGENAFGQLGTGNTTNSIMPVVVPGLANIVAISAGDETSFALTSSGTVWAWGRGDYGQIGNGTGQNSNVPALVGNGTLNSVVAIESGDHHCLAQLASGEVKAWGRNSNGQLGNNSTANANSPVQVSFATPANVIAVAAGEGSSYALRSDNTVWCWGDGGAGQMGNGTASDSYVPTMALIATPNIVEIAAGARHVLARRSNQTLVGWGSNAQGALATSAVSASTLPIAIATPSSVVAISAGYTSVALRSDGTIWLWGYGIYGEMGNGTSNSVNPIPTSPQMPYLGGAFLGPAGSGTLGSEALLINGSAGVVASNGFRPRRVDVPINASITIDVLSINGVSAYYIIYGIIGVPKASDAVALPFGVGTMAFMPFSLNPNFPGTFMLANSFGPHPAAQVPSVPTPWSYVLPLTVPFPFQFTLQGVHYDPINFVIGITNGVIVNIQ